jgi:N-acetylmuramic acid 6-phosphate etherase
VSAESKRISRAASTIAKVLGEGGRLFFVGAGTSGRLGVLEASECPPTFGTAPSQIVAIVAGGNRSVFRSQEGAEDREDEARLRLRARNVGGKDVVVGISASSVTPFVRAALAEARRQGAKTVLITCGRPTAGVADICLAPRVGPEVLAGSTRLKAGTATKLVLNRLTLLAMIQLGKVHGPYMVDLQARSKKLLDRATRVVSAIGGVGYEEAGVWLEKAGRDVRTAIVMARSRSTRAEARRCLARHGGKLRDALAEMERAHKR